MKTSKLKKKLQQVRNGNIRKSIKSEWSVVEIRKEEIELMPWNIIMDQQETIDKLLEQNGLLNDELEKKTSNLYNIQQKDEIQNLKKKSYSEHSGRPFSEVGEKQKSRQLKQIR